MVMVREKKSKQTATRLGQEIQRRMSLLGITYDELSMRTQIVKSRLHRIAHGESLQWLAPDELESIAVELDTTTEDLLRAAGYRLTAA